tara:strand:+ start:850 stop:1083 length:234 start_codon:yes stop_codon:yes gene_type:complete
MNSYQLKYKFDYENVAKRQEEWRLKQFHIFYGSGRPIFNIDEETEHLRFHRDPSYIIDKNKRHPVSKKEKKENKEII